jgi:hypothetical protein
VVNVYPYDGYFFTLWVANLYPHDSRFSTLRVTNLYLHDSRFPTVRVANPYSHDSRFSILRVVSLILMILAFLPSGWPICILSIVTFYLEGGQSSLKRNHTFVPETPGSYISVLHLLMQNC